MNEFLDFDEVRCNFQFNGQEPANGYFQFHFTAEFLKKRYLREIGEEKRFIEEVYLEERDQVEDRRLVGV
ncbi:hypothetical protein IT413_03400 [Candidatus Peregrinibacteria bacterium]|nr:hypothetical protein [Candidatus Peregrinibacteria bacterium]